MGFVRIEIFYVHLINTSLNGVEQLYGKYIKKRPCTEVKYHGLYDGKSLLPYAIERNWELKRSKINYDIEILTKLNQKSITIKLSDSVPFERVHAILCKILRYECLFDGRFFKNE